MYVNVKCKSCLYHIDICIFNCNFLSKIQIKNHLTKKRVWCTFLLVFNRSSKKHVSGHILSDWPHDLISALWKVLLNFPDFPFLKLFVKAPSSWQPSKVTTIHGGIILTVFSAKTIFLFLFVLYFFTWWYW